MVTFSSTCDIKTTTTTKCAFKIQWFYQLSWLFIVFLKNQYSCIQFLLVYLLIYYKNIISSHIFVAIRKELMFSASSVSQTLCSTSSPLLPLWQSSQQRCPLTLTDSSVTLVDNIKFQLVIWSLFLYIVLVLHPACAICHQ